MSSVKICKNCFDGNHSYDYVLLRYLCMADGCVCENWEPVEINPKALMDELADIKEAVRITVESCKCETCMGLWASVNK